MKYRKKSLIVEAEQWFPGKDVPGVFAGYHATFAPYVITIHGQAASLSPGDWVITEPDGVHHYPCKDEIFHNTYELAE